MKIGIMGDTHGNTYQLNKAMELLRDCEMVLHTGDFYRDIRTLPIEQQKKITAVAGNCDYQKNIPSEKIIDVSGKRLFLCHGHHFGVKTGLNRLYYKALEVGANIAIFGHTHVPALVEENGIFLVNPGSASEPRIASEPTCLRLHLQEPFRSEFLAISS